MSSSSWAGAGRPAIFSASEAVAAGSWRLRPAGPFPLSPESVAPCGVRVADRYDIPHVEHCFRHVPRRLSRLVGTRYANLWRSASRVEANQWALSVGNLLSDGRAGVAESEDRIRRAAKERAAEASRMLSRLGVASADLVRAQLVEYLDRWCIPEPLDRARRRLPLSGLCARVADASWWRRKLRAHVARNLENFARDIGAVHRRAGVYVSDDAQHRHADRQRRGARFLADTDLLNVETAELVPLADVARGSVSNPAIRRAELMLRLRGFEEWAQSQGEVGVFYTITTPSRFHARKHDGTENPRYAGHSPREAQAHLCGLWSRFRAWADRAGVHPYGVRIAEPHHDGTPHWHLLLFMRPDHVGAVAERLRVLALEVDGNEPGAARHRFQAVAIDASRGSAAGYVAKYIAKNIDGYEVGASDEAAEVEGVEASDRARAWASTWGIRQFQQVGGPGIGIWRELRRIREVPAGALLARCWTAADGGHWRDYVDNMGGTRCRRRDRPIGVYTASRPGRCNRYQEPAAPRTEGLQCGRVRVCTHPDEWLLRPGGGFTRTRGNNCTAAASAGNRAPAENYARWRPPSPG